MKIIQTSDLHLSSKKPERIKALENIISKAIEEKVGLLLISGDLFDSDEQADSLRPVLRNMLSSLPFTIIAIPGNHDAVRQALPQPAIEKDFAEPIYELENITILGNPSWIKLNERIFLLYHGTSINDIVSFIPSLSIEKPEKALRYSIDARHMAISFGSSTPIAPEREDMLVIEKVPDVMQSGHIHISGYENYRGTLLISCAAWQAQTEYQRKMGVIPTIGEAVILNLGTLEMGVMDFKKNEKIKSINNIT